MQQASSSRSRSLALCAVRAVLCALRCALQHTAHAAAEQLGGAAAGRGVRDETTKGRCSVTWPGPDSETALIRRPWPLASVLVLHLVSVVGPVRAGPRITTQKHDHLGLQTLAALASRLADVAAPEPILTRLGLPPLRTRMQRCSVCYM